MMAALMIGVAVIIKIISLFVVDMVFGIFAFETISGLSALITFLVVIMITGSHILQFFQKNFFDDAGYLMLTLPVTRAKLLLSKVVVAMIWFNFMLLVGIIASFILSWAQHLEMSLTDITSPINLPGFITLLEINIIALFIILAIFFTVTLSNCIIGQIKLPSGIAGIFTLAYGGFVLWLGVRLGMRHSEWVNFEERIYHYGDYGSYGGVSIIHSSIRQRETGIAIGRIAIGDTAYFDVFIWGMVLGMAVLLLFVTYILLNKRVSLD